MRFTQLLLRDPSVFICAGSLCLMEAVYLIVLEF